MRSLKTQVKTIWRKRSRDWTQSSSRNSENPKVPSNRSEVCFPTSQFSNPLSKSSPLQKVVVILKAQHLSMTSPLTSAKSSKIKQNLPTPCWCQIQNQNFKRVNSQLRILNKTAKMNLVASVSQLRCITWVKKVLLKRICLKVLMQWSLMTTKSLI